MSWWVGQQVSVLREAGVFTVKVIEADALQLEDENGFCYRYLQSMVVARQEIQIQQITVKDAQMAQKPKAQKPVSTKENALPSIDLHAEELGVAPGKPNFWSSTGQERGASSKKSNSLFYPDLE
jgi:hypothetical protein